MTEARNRGQSGELLLEVLVSMAILGLGIVGGLFALASLIRVSSTHQAITRSSIEASVAAEGVERIAYRACTASTSTPTAATYQADLSSVPYSSPPGLSVLLTVTDVKYLTSSSAQTAAFGNSCPALGDQGAQLLQIRVEATTTHGTKVRSNLKFIKRETTCIGLADAVQGQTC